MGRLGDLWWFIDVHCRPEMSDDEELLTAAEHNFAGLESRPILIRQGAEAKVFRCEFLGRKAVVKLRFAKKYRHPQLDETLTKDRLKAECRSLVKAKEMGLAIPTLFHVDTVKNLIVMEMIEDSQPLKVFITETLEKPNCREVLGQVGMELGRMVALLHRNSLIHGDLTTSNFLTKSSGDELKIFLIDFGLSFHSTMVEDKGVDLYELQNALISTHSQWAEEIFKAVMTSYQQHYGHGADAIGKKLEQIRLRGRKREMIG